MRHRKNRRLALAYALIVAVELLVTVLAGWAVARWAIPYAYAERGYWAVGGEWILTAGAALFALWATNHMFFGGVRNAGKVQKMPQDTKGGHDIPYHDVERRFSRRFADVVKLLPYCDEAKFFDNDNGFVLVAEYRNGELLPVGDKRPAWLLELIATINQHNAQL